VAKHVRPKVHHRGIQYRGDGLDIGSLAASFGCRVHFGLSRTLVDALPLFNQAASYLNFPEVKDSVSDALKGRTAVKGKVKWKCNAIAP
jgi:hypothetical protein